MLKIQINEENIGCFHRYFWYFWDIINFGRLYIKVVTTENQGNVISHARYSLLSYRVNCD